MLFPKLFNHDFPAGSRALPHVAAQRYDLADQAAAREGVLIARHDEDRFDIADGSIR